MRSRAGKVTEISGIGMKILPYEHSSPGDRDETFYTEQLYFRNIAAKMA